MDRKALERYENKHIIITFKNNKHVYTCRILELHDTFLVAKEKYGKDVTISYDTIGSVNEQ